MRKYKTKRSNYGKLIEYLFDKLLEVKSKHPSYNFYACYQEVIETYGEEIEKNFGEPYSASNTYVLLTDEQKDSLKVGRKHNPRGSKKFDENVLKIFPYVFKRFYNTEKKGTDKKYTKQDCYRIAVETCKDSGFTDKQIPTYKTVTDKYFFFNLK